MTSLMELPIELLSQILEDVGGSALRRGNGSARLCVSRKWFAAARPVYLSGLGTTDIKIFGHNLNDLDSKYGYNGHRHLMHKNTRKLRIRLVGHWWDESSSQRVEAEDLEDVEDAPTPDPNEPPFQFYEIEHQDALVKWRDEPLKTRLEELFQDLRHFEALQSLTFEASSDPEVGYERGPHWDYLYETTLSHFLTNLPILHDLTNLTLDIGGLSTGFAWVEEHEHLCTSIARILPRIENVRLRMHNICPAIFQIEDDLKATGDKLKTLIIKLHLSSFSHTDEARVMPCFEMPGSRTNLSLLQSLARTSGPFLDKLATLRGGEHGMAGFRISYAYPGTPSVSTLDCLTMKKYNLPEEYFLYEDDGKPYWYELAEKGRMLYGGEFRYNGRA